MISLTRQINKCDVYLLLWFLYYLQGIIYPKGSIIGLILVAINIAVSLGLSFKVTRMPNLPIYFHGLNILVMMLTIYGIIPILNGATATFSAGGEFHSFASYNYLKNAYLSLMPIYAFYYFSVTGYLTENKLKVWIFLFFISVTLSYFQDQEDALLHALEIGSSREEFTNNTGYKFLALIPAMVLFRKKPLIMYSGLAYIIVFLIMGMKRGAILIGALSSLYFVFSSFKLVEKSKRKKLVLFIIVLAIVGFQATQYMLDNSDFFLTRIESTLSGNSSHRDELFGFFWSHYWSGTNLFEFLFGNGAWGALKLFYNNPHNDWLLVMTEQGLIGIVIYLIYWRCFIKQCSVSTNIEARIAISMIAIIYFSRTLFSMSYADMTYVVTSVLGFYLANYQKQNE